MLIFASINLDFRYNDVKESRNIFLALPCKKVKDLRSILCRFRPLSPSQIQLEPQAKRAKPNSTQFTPCINVVLLLFHTCQEYACVPATGQHVVVVCMHGKNERMAKFHSAHIKMSIGPCEKGQYL